MTDSAHLDIISSLGKTVVSSASLDEALTSCLKILGDNIDELKDSAIYVVQDDNAQIVAVHGNSTVFPQTLSPLPIQSAGAPWKPVSITEKEGVFTFLPVRDGDSTAGLISIFSAGIPVNEHISKILLCLESQVLLGIYKYASTTRDFEKARQHEMDYMERQKLNSLASLAGGIAHQFNNLLTAIIGNIYLVRMSMDPSDKYFSKLIETETICQRAKTLTNELLEFSKHDVSEKKVFFIRSLIMDSAHSAVRGSNSKCNFILDDKLWAVEVDEKQIGRALQYLITNAHQAMTRGGEILITAKNVSIPAGKDSEAQRHVKISIQDFGNGIPKEIIRKIFEPYFTTKEGSSGLGLPAAYSIVKNHGGALEVESEIGSGTTVHVTIPALDIEPETVKPVQRIQVDDTRQDIDIRPLVGKGKILLMDDEKMVRDVVQEMLNEIGYQVETAEEGVQAVEMYKKALEEGSPYDVIVSDLTVQGGLGGKETMKDILKVNPRAKGIVSSGFVNDPVMSDFLDYGFKGVVAKPYDLKELNTVLIYVLNLEDDDEDLDIDFNELDDV